MNNKATCEELEQEVWHLQDSLEKLQQSHFNFKGKRNWNLQGKHEQTVPYRSKPLDCWNSK